MLTDTEARTLLHQAADTIEVGPTAPFVVPPRRAARPLLVAAAAVAMLLVVSAVAVWRSQREAPAEHPPPGRVTVPSLIGYRVADAVRLLNSQGLEPHVRKEPTCRDDGRTLRTRPWAGTKVAPGSRVIVEVATSAAMRCLASPTEGARLVAWPLVDLARGLASTAPFADHVLVSINDQPRVTLSAAEASDPDNWPVCDNTVPRCPGSALDLIRSGADFALNSHGYFVQPELFARPTSGDGSSVAFFIGRPSVGTGEPPAWAVTVQTKPSGVITSVRLEFPTGHHFVPGPGRSVVEGDPTGLGRRFVAFARGRSGDLPTAPEIRLYVQHNFLRTMSAGEMQDPEQWRFCPTLPARCGFSAVDVVASLHGQIVVSGTATGQERCFARAGAPQPLGGDRLAAVLRPAADLPCTEAWAVYLYRDRAGRLSGVDLLT